MANAFEEGWFQAREEAAKVAEEFWTGIIRCKHQDDPEHVRMHVEHQWATEVARRIRAIEY